MLTRIPSLLQKQDDIYRIVSYDDIFQRLEQEQDFPVQVVEDRNRLVSENTKRVYSVKNHQGIYGKRVLDCVTRQVFYEKECGSQEEFDNEKKNAMILYEKFGSDLDNMVNVIRDIDEEENRIYYENGVITFKQVCEHMSKNKIFWFDRQNSLRHTFKQIFYTLHRFYETGFYFSNISNESITFCRKDGGEENLVAKLLDLGFGSFDYQNIEHLGGHNSNKIVAPQNEEERKFIELNILCDIFEQAMVDSVVEYEQNILQVFKDIAKKPENYDKVPYEINPQQKIKEYFEDDIIQVINAIRLETSYENILETILNLQIDENDPKLEIRDEENIFNTFLIKKISEIKIASKEEFFAYLQILKSLDQWEKGVKLIQENLEKFPFEDQEENLKFLEESVYFYIQAKCEDFKDIAQKVVTIYQEVKKSKKDKPYMNKLSLFNLFLVSDAEEQTEIYTESVDYFNLNKEIDLESFAYIQLLLGQIFILLKNTQLAQQYLQQSSIVYNEQLKDLTENHALVNEFLVQFLTKPQAKLQHLNYIFNVFKQERIYEGQKYAELIENYGDALIATSEQQADEPIVEQSQQNIQRTSTNIQNSQAQQQVYRKESIQGDIEIGEVNYAQVCECYNIAYEIFQYSLGHNNSHALRLKNKLCSYLKFLEQKDLYIENVLQNILLQPNIEAQQINDLVLESKQEQLEDKIKESIIEQADINEKYNKFQEAQSLLEACIPILNKLDKSELLNTVTYKLEILRLKHMYEETQKEFLLTEGFEKSLTSQDKNYFFKRWNINLILKGDLKTALKSIVNNLPNCENSKEDCCESLILISCIYKKMMKYEEAQQNILRCKQLATDCNIYYLQDFVREQIEIIKFLAKQKLENKLKSNKEKYDRLIKAKSCQDHEILRLQMNSALLYEEQNNFGASKDILQEVIKVSDKQNDKPARRQASVSINRLYEKKLISQLENQIHSKRPSTAF